MGASTVRAASKTLQAVRRARGVRYSGWCGREAGRRKQEATATARGKRSSFGRCWPGRHSTTPQ